MPSQGKTALNYFVIVGEETRGPYTLGQLQAMWRSGSLTGNMLHCREGDAQWTPLSNLAPMLEDAKAGQDPKKWRKLEMQLALLTIGGMLLAAVTPLGTVLFVGGLLAFIAVRMAARWQGKA